jgi:tetratricopeptide (TPR) repeat protein
MTELLNSKHLRSSHANPGQTRSAHRAQNLSSVATTATNTNGQRASSTNDLTLEEHSNPTTATLKKALAMMRAKAFTEAEALLRELERAGVTSPELSYSLGFLALTTNPQIAKGHFSRAIELDPRHANAFYFLGLIESNQNAALAQSYFRAALKQNPSHAGAINKLQEHERLTNASSSGPAPSKLAHPAHRKFHRLEVQPEQDIEEYGRALARQKQIEFWIANWTGLPPAVRIVKLAIGATFLVAFVILASHVHNAWRESEIRRQAFAQEADRMAKEQSEHLYKLKNSLDRAYRQPNVSPRDTKSSSSTTWGSTAGSEAAANGR